MKLAAADPTKIYFNKIIIYQPQHERAKYYDRGNNELHTHVIRIAFIKKFSALVCYLN